MILKMLSNNDTKDIFSRYCLNGEISDDLKKKVEDYKRLIDEKKKLNEKEEEEEKIAKKKDDKKKVFPKENEAQEETTRLLNNKRSSGRKLTLNEERKKRMFEATVKNLESVSEETYSYDPGKNSDLGINKHKNIKLRLRESKFN